MDEGDLIVALGDQPIATIDDLQKRLTEMPVGIPARSSCCAAIAGWRASSFPVNIPASRSDCLSPFGSCRRTAQPRPVLYDLQQWAPEIGRGVEVECWCSAGLDRWRGVFWAWS